MKKILIVDDDEAIRDVLTFILQDAGYEVECLATGTKVLEKLCTYKADLLLMDIMIAGMDGRLICTEVKTNKSTCNVPILLMSGTHYPDWSDEINERPDGFFEKPFDIDTLIQQITRLAA